ncbi:MAG: hypothetical protein ACFHX7_09300 [Pseudomonadota bacterium]
MSHSQSNRQTTLFWNRVLGIADAIEAGHCAPGHPATSQMDQVHHAREQLAGLIEGFGEQFDPADAFPEYATLLLCRALERTLDQRNQETATNNRPRPGTHTQTT